MRAKLFRTRLYTDTEVRRAIEAVISLEDGVPINVKRDVLETFLDALDLIRKQYKKCEFIGRFACCYG